ncbi:MAG TPA: glycosyltransferase family 2 protein [Isosphaeraceae bacterium]|nr:glycosyltransferase family 2 protein [Isosphaeraceae bacterium]
MIPTIVATLIFWACLALVTYAYVGYPLLIWGLSRVVHRPAVPPAGDDAELPMVSLLIAAHNEEAVIEDRLRNALAMDYPPAKLEVVVSSDGSTDRTTEIVRRYAGRDVRLLDYVRRRGKAAVLNASVPELRGEIVMFSDANTQFDAAAARKLVRWLRDPEVGAACGEMVLADPRTGKNAESLYWKYETFLKQCEGRLGALLGASGGIYAIRKGVFTPIPEGTILDDFVIPLLAKLRHGTAIVYDSEAVAYEETAPELGSEFRRRCRIGAGGFQSLGLLWGLLHPRWGWTALAFASHKILRWLCPFFLIGLLVSNLVLVLSDSDSSYPAALAAQLAFYAISAVMAVVPARFRILKPLRLATMFTGMNLALLLGFWKWLRGSQQGVWQRTVRAAENADGVAR